MDRLLTDFVLLFTIIDPIGSVPVFIAIAARAPQAHRRALALRAVAVSAGVLLFFAVCGQLLLDAMQIPLAAFQIAGGVMLFLFALDMVFGQSKPESEVSAVNNLKEIRDLAIYPLAIPSIAGPGSIIAIMVATDNATRGFGEQAATIGVMFVILGIVLACLMLAERIHRLIGEAGAAITSRVMGLITGAVAVNAVLGGVVAYFGLGQAP